MFEYPDPTKTLCPAWPRCQWFTRKTLVAGLPDIDAHMVEKHPETPWAQRVIARRRQSDGTIG